MEITFTCPDCVKHRSETNYTEQQLLIWPIFYTIWNGIAITRVFSKLRHEFVYVQHFQIPTLSIWPEDIWWDLLYRERICQFSWRRCYRLGRSNQNEEKNNTLFVELNLDSGVCGVVCLHHWFMMSKIHRSPHVTSACVYKKDLHVIVLTSTF